MTTVFYARSNGRLIVIQSNLRKKKLHMKFLGDSFSNRDNVRAPIEVRRNVNPSVLQDDFSS